MRLFSSIILLFLVYGINAQSWFEPTDEWTYRYFAPFATEGFMTMHLKGDTLVNGQLAKCLNQDFVAINQSNGDSVLISQDLITYESGNKIFIQDLDGNFKLTYDFNLQVGDSIVYTINGFGLDCELPVTYYLDSLSTFTLGNDSLIHQFFSFYDANWNWSGTREIVETIGVINSGFDINLSHGCLFDLPGTWLCMFSDSGNEANVLNEDCFRLPVNTDDLSETQSFLSPNPVQRILSVNNLEFEQLDIYSLQGFKVKTVYAPHKDFDVSQLYPGIYLAVLRKANQKVASQLFIKE